MTSRRGFLGFLAAAPVAAAVPAIGAGGMLALPKPLAVGPVFVRDWSAGVIHVPPLDWSAPESSGPPFDRAFFEFDPEDPATIRRALGLPPSESEEIMEQTSTMGISRERILAERRADETELGCAKRLWRADHPDEAAAADLRRWCEIVRGYCQRDTDPARTVRRVVGAAELLRDAERRGFPEADLRFALECVGLGGIDCDAAAAQVVGAAAVYGTALDEAAAAAVSARPPIPLPGA